MQTIRKGCLPTKLMLSLVLLMTGGSAYALDRLYLATQDWPPYQTVKQGQIGGVAVERVQCALRRMGQPYEIKMMRWDKAQLLVEANKMHGYFSGSKSPSRALYSDPSDPLISEELSWFVSPGVSLDLDDESAKYKARYSAKFNTNKWLNLKEQGYNVVKKPRDADSLLQMLWQGDIDVALEYRLVFEHSMKSKKIPLDYFRRVAYGTQDLMVHFSKDFTRKNPVFLGNFNKALKQCL